MVVILALAVLIFGIKFAGKGSFFEDNFSKSQTRALKGLCAIYIIFHHLCTYLADFFPSFYAFKYLGFLMVGVFFFISGYGLMYGVANKEGYLNGFFKKRVTSVLIPFYIINLFSLAANYTTGSLTVKTAVLSLFGVYMWYVAAIVILYIGFYLSFKIFALPKGILAVSVYTLLYILGMFVLHRFFNINSLGFWWYNSAICFALGIWYCLLRKKINKVICNNYFKVLLLCLIMFVPLYVFICNHFNDDMPSVLVCEILICIVFTVFIIAMTLKFKIKNPVLNICGDLSLELYLSHALFIYALRSEFIVCNIKLYIQNNFLYFIAILLCTFVFSYIVNKAAGIIKKVLIN